MSQGQDSLRATDMIYMFPFNEMIQPECCPCVTYATVPCCTSPDPQWTSSNEHTCSRMKMTSLLKLCWESQRDLPCQCSNQQLAQWNTISSLELSPSCHHVAWWRRKAWCLDKHGFIPKKIQWHIHAGLWSLVNWWCEVLMRHYIRCSWILMTAAVGLMEWPLPW